MYCSNLTFLVRAYGCTYSLLAHISLLHISLSHISRYLTRRHGHCDLHLPLFLSTPYLHPSSPPLTSIPPLHPLPPSLLSTPYLHPSSPPQSSISRAGMNTAIYTVSGASAGIGFAIPVDTLRYEVETLIRDGKVCWWVVVLCTSSVPFLGSMEVRTRNPGGPNLISDSLFHLWGLSFASPEVRF
jgi:hypothetical protein